MVVVVVGVDDDHDDDDDDDDLIRVGDDDIYEDYCVVYTVVVTMGIIMTGPFVFCKDGFIGAYLKPRAWGFQAL